MVRPMSCSSETCGRARDSTQLLIGVMTVSYSQPGRSSPEANGARSVPTLRITRPMSSGIAESDLDSVFGPKLPIIVAAAQSGIGTCIADNVVTTGAPRTPCFVASARARWG